MFCRAVLLAALALAGLAGEHLGERLGLRPSARVRDVLVDERQRRVLVLGVASASASS